MYFIWLVQQRSLPPNLGDFTVVAAVVERLKSVAYGSFKGDIKVKYTVIIRYKVWLNPVARRRHPSSSGARRR